MLTEMVYQSSSPTFPCTLKSVKNGTAKVPLALWFIAERPEDEVTGSFAQFNSILEAEAYRNGAELWKKHCAGKPSAAILINAANYFAVNDAVQAENLLRRGLADYPNDAHFPELMGQADMRALVQSVPAGL